MSDKMTDESVTLDITNKTRYDIWRHHVIRKHRYRRVGIEPPPLRNVNITVTAWEKIRDIAVAKGYKNAPFYDWMRVVLAEYEKVTEELKETEEWLELAVKDKQDLKAQIEKTKQDILLITKNNDSGVSLE